jgi:hypothetical protein
MDKKDLILYFEELQKKYSEEDIIVLLENYEISKLDVQRLYRYIDKISNYGINTHADADINNNAVECES